MGGATSKKTHASGHGVVLSLTATVLWAVGSLLSKHSLKWFPPLTLLVIELVASVSSLSFLLFATRRGKPMPRKMLRLSIPGLLQPGVAYALSFVGLKWLDSVSVESLIWSAEGVLMIPFSIAFLDEKVTVRTFLLGTAALFGIAMVTIPSGLASSGAAPKLAGSTLILGAVFAACWYTVLAQRDLRDHDPLFLTVLHHSAGLGVALFLVLLNPAPRGTSVMTPCTIAEAGLAGVCLFAAPFWLFLRSIQLIGSSSTTQFLPFEPVVTILLAVVSVTIRFWTV